jgi:hypothetical protein
MIEITKNYKITLNEEQARLLYNILDMTDNDRRRELNGLYDELKGTLKIGIRHKETDNYSHLYAPGTK